MSVLVNPTTPHYLRFPLLENITITVQHTASLVGKSLAFRMAEMSVGYPNLTDPVVLVETTPAQIAIDVNDAIITISRADQEAALVARRPYLYSVRITDPGGEG